jgi:hypothetical protein
MPGRSIAVDRLHEYGTPFFIEANLPIDSVKSVSPFGRLMIAQDTGSALVGPARADLYWGAGDDAGRIAGRIRHRGRFAMLLPRELDMMAAGTQMPLPVPKPKISGAEDKSPNGKKADSANAGESAAGKKASPNTKLVATEVAKQSGKTLAPSLKTGEMAAPKKPSPNVKLVATEVGKQSGKAPAPSGKASQTAASRNPSPNLKIIATEVGKQSGKASAVLRRSGDTRPGIKMPLAKFASEPSKQDSKDEARPGKPGEVVAGRAVSLRKQKAGAVETGKQEGEAKTRPARSADTVAAKQSRVANTAAPARDINKQRGKAKPESANSDATDGRRTPSSKPIELKKQEGQREAKAAPAAENGKAPKRLRAGKPPARESATAQCSDCIR